MQYLFYLVGFIIALAVFLYVLNAYESGRAKIKSLKGAPGGYAGERATTVEPRDIFLKKPRAHPGERLCPLCGSALSQSEALYAAPLKTGDGTKILILGCRYCYKEDDIKGAPPESR
ncbi:MAG TPA: hypothetical protein PKO25_03680 [Spirochaetota bacterium]|nr:hypothetical protein [Spirochaetota bacterium]OPZ37061.1 MAG: hypothetical protein BWY96_01883 [Spirochaetes bacterium ADurb.BinA120]HNU90952.1 hypothetical protein [Spirochaetota bacterium]HPI13306.1 hypothetical protein [Spirochaetota bacterium]HPO44561.1 hypothetical protein [Spirochaetota bacterium]